jgi:hypothetical protein
MEFFGDLLQGAVWLVCLGALAVIVLAAVVVAGVRRASGRAAGLPRSDESGQYRDEDFRTIEAPRSDELGRYQGGDVRTTTETTTTSTDGTTVGAPRDIDDRTP